MPNSHLDGHDKVSLYLEEVLSVDGHDPSLVRLSHVSKHHVNHRCRRGRKEGRGGGKKGEREREGGSVTQASTCTYLWKDNRVFIREVPQCPGTQENLASPPFTERKVLNIYWVSFAAYFNRLFVKYVLKLNKLQSSL